MGKKTNGKKINGKKTNRKKKKSSIFSQSVRLALKMLLFVSLVTMIILLLLFYNRYGKTFINTQSEAKELVRSSTLETFRQSETSLVYDVNGDVLSVLKGEKDVYYINYEDIPEYVKTAMISIEDKQFNSHNGVDMKANLRAVVALIRNKGDITQGASTITQQLSRNIFLTNEVSYQRKIKEIQIALELEKKYSKDQILEFYLNNIYFANGYYGIQAASKGYFNTNVKKLSLSQIAFLCAIPNNPTIYNPTENKENTLNRRNRILDQMYEDGKVSLEECNTAKTEKIKLKTKKVSKSNYVETYVFNCATKALMKKSGFEFRYQFENENDKKEYEESYDKAYTQNQRSIYTSGYRIYTSIDMQIQESLQESVDEELSEFTEKTEEGIYQLQSAATCIDNKTGRVIAIVGGRYQDTIGYPLNRAYQSYRQPGSAIKPLIVYTPAIEVGYYPDSIVTDKRIKGGPTNSNGSYSGRMTLRRAVEVSKNTIAWKIFEEITPKVGLSYIENMNFSKLEKDDYYLAASLGGFTNGVNTVEMASAYVALENDGMFREPTCIIKIMDSEGNVMVEDQMMEKQIYTRNAARMMTDILEGVIKNGTGKGLGLPNISTAGKTGTTNKKKDGWFVGYTPYYTTSVWVGYDMPKTLSGLSGGTYPGQIWHTFMLQLHKGLKEAEFEPYTDERDNKIENATKVENIIREEDTELLEEGDLADQLLEDTSKDVKKDEEEVVDVIAEDNNESEEETQLEEESDTQELDSNDNESQETQIPDIDVEPVIVPEIDDIITEENNIEEDLTVYPDDELVEDFSSLKDEMESKIKTDKK